MFSNILISKFTLLDVRFSICRQWFIFDENGQMWEERSFGSHCFKGGNQTMWSSLMINYVSVTIEKSKFSSDSHDFTVTIGMLLLTMTLQRQLLWVTKAHVVMRSVERWDIHTSYKNEWAVGHLSNRSRHDEMRRYNQTFLTRFDVRQHVLHRLPGLMSRYWMQKWRICRRQRWT